MLYIIINVFTVLEVQRLLVTEGTKESFIDQHLICTLSDQ